MRIAGALAVSGLAFVLVTCGGDAMSAAAGGSSEAGTPDTATATPTPTPSSTGSANVAIGSIACAPDGATSFAETCSVERVEVDGKRLLAVFHPDGGFRRFEQLADGSGLAVVAGADELTQTLSGDTLEISIAGNRYRFPVTSQ